MPPSPSSGPPIAPTSLSISLSSTIDNTPRRQRPSRGGYATCLARGSRLHCIGTDAIRASTTLRKNSFSPSATISTLPCLVAGQRPTPHGWVYDGESRTFPPLGWAKEERRLLRCFNQI